MNFCKSLLHKDFAKTLGEGFRLDQAVRECKDPIEQERLKQLAKENLHRCHKLQERL